MNQTEYKKASRGRLKEAGYKILPERWVKADKFDKIMKFIRKAGAVAGSKDLD